ncbi:MAG: hypothetical protein AAFP20_19260 [Cyanobacteria bacterium J06614_10]
MRDLIDPFMTFYGDHPDHNQADGRRETKALLTRQGLIEDWLEGFESAESVLDCLEEQGIGADAFVKMVEANVQHVIDGGRAYIQNESGLLIPELVGCPGT